MAVCQDDDGGGVSASRVRGSYTFQDLARNRRRAFPRQKAPRPSPCRFRGRRFLTSCKPACDILVTGLKSSKSSQMQRGFVRLALGAAQAVERRRVIEHTQSVAQHLYVVDGPALDLFPHKHYTSLSCIKFSSIALENKA